MNTIARRARARNYLIELTVRHHRLVAPTRIVLDVLAMCAAIAVAIFLRRDLTFEGDDSSGFWKMVPLIAALQILAGVALGLYRGRYRYGSYDEIAALCATALTTTIALFALNEFYFDERPTPQSSVLVGGVVGLMLMAGIRYAWRLLLEKLRRPNEDSAEKMLVFGAGEAGVQIVTALLRNQTSRLLPVGFIDDAPKKQRLKVMGVPMLGDRGDIEYAADHTGATTLLVAIPSVSAETLTDVTNRSARAGMSVKVLPSVEELLDGSVGTNDIRDLSDEDLLGRRQLDTNIEEISSYIQGRRVLVSGAGGSIGSELCRQLSRLQPSELIMLDRDESALQAAEMSMHGRSLLDSDQTVLADIRDLSAVREVFETRRPEVVFHAAALKHLTLLERFPDEAFKTNVIGTWNVLQVAEETGVNVLVNVSSDKAANPSSILGYSKRVAERLTSEVGHRSGGRRYLSVRFGNVLGSRGSVLGIFQAQIGKGGPITITDRLASRYFMTIPEAVQLVIQAGAIGDAGEVLILDMGEPVNIYDLACQLVQRSGRDIAIEFTGLRPGEKMHEELLGSNELDSRLKHHLISHAKVPALDPEKLYQPPLEIRSRMIELS